MSLHARKNRLHNSCWILNIIYILYLWEVNIIVDESLEWNKGIKTLQSWIHYASTNL